MGHPNPFRVMLTVKIFPGKEEEFEKTWLTIGDRVTANPANLGQWLTKLDEPGMYLIVSDWVNEEQFREFEKTDGHLEHRVMLKPLREHGTMATGTVVAHMTGAASS